MTAAEVEVMGAEVKSVREKALTDRRLTPLPAVRLVFHIFAALAQMERRLISERTHAGLEAARERGRVGGRPTVMTPERLKAAHDLRVQGTTVTQIAKTLGVGRATVTRALSTSG